ncbi:hypothetical protein [Croceicoccus bisphenolivorans]|uniref:hypothetical protein n=1 Tax=Croceicoccus bisphenolivorans TaxID=1783232 RepID=UPI000B1B1F96|nr:hypothetical protein [Croceicoccus bisphenolivorans]
MKGRRRGQPLVAFAGVMVAWVGFRAWGPMDALLDAPLPLPPTVAGRVEPAAEAMPVERPVNDISQPVAISRPAKPDAVAAAPVEFLQTGSVAPVVLARTAPPAPVPTQSAPPEYEQAPEPKTLPSAQVPFGAVPPEVRARRRWSADAWVLWREKGRAGAALVGGGTYGASQAGAVLRYRIAPDSRFDPRAYFRATTTLSPEYEVEGAAGIAVRPLARLPVDLMAEGRVLHFFGDEKLRPSETRVRPAVMAVAGPPPLPLVAGARAEAYAQVGYVGGEGASTFADGQVRVVRDVPLLAPGKYRLEAGLGAWGGAQKGVHRVDVGPTAALRFPIGKKVFGRASLDWRQRVAGDAEPGSGPVFTLSAGF